MKAMFPHMGAAAGARDASCLPLDESLPSSARPDDRACCCPAQPVVRAIMPATAQRGSVDLLLCGHHYRVSRQALAAAGARIEEMPGKAGAAEAALLENVHRDHAELSGR